MLLVPVALGVAISAVAMLVATGSAIYIVAGLTGVVPVFYVMATTAFAERIGQYALTRNAIQMLVTPLNTLGRK